MIEVALVLGMLYCGYKLAERPINRLLWKRRLRKGIGGEKKYSRYQHD